jgi:hypothetical protein
VSDFAIDIVNHRWIDNDPENETDECSHGRFLLTIGGQEILTYSDEIEDWTTSTSVLRLLRTIENDFNQEDRGYGILLHCGMIQMISCPIAIDWILTHEGRKVVIREIKKYPSSDDSRVIDFKGLEVSIDIKDYTREVVKVARQVKEFFSRSKPRKLMGVDIECNREFWQEFDALLLKYS